MFAIAEAIILPLALVIAVLRGLPGPMFFPIRAAGDRLRRLLPRHPDDPARPAARLRRPVVAALLATVERVLLGDRVARSSSTRRTSPRSTGPGSSRCTRARRQRRARSGSRTPRALRYVDRPAGGPARDPAAAQRLHRPAEGHRARRASSASSTRSSRRTSTRARRSTSPRTAPPRCCSSRSRSR